MARTDPVVEKVRKQLQHRDRAWVKLSTLVTAAGQKKGSVKLLTEIEQALEEAGIYHSPSDLLTCPAGETVFISTQPFHETGLPFQSEKELSEFIARHYRLLQPFRHCTSVVREFRLPGLKADLMFREANGGRIVCELERGTGRYEPGSQIIGYVEAAQKWAETMTPPPRIRGVVITGAPNPRQEAIVAQWCQHSGQDITWYYYRLGLELIPNR
jgi:hypothetical protein